MAHAIAEYGRPFVVDMHNNNSFSFDDWRRTDKRSKQSTNLLFQPVNSLVAHNNLHSTCKIQRLPSQHLTFTYVYVDSLNEAVSAVCTLHLNVTVVWTLRTSSTSFNVLFVYDSISLFLVTDIRAAQHSMPCLNIHAPMLLIMRFCIVPNLRWTSQLLLLYLFENEECVERAPIGVRIAAAASTSVAFCSSTENIK